jgi:N6-adenosine-specific RNA methylase IME4
MLALGDIELERRRFELLSPIEHWTPGAKARLIAAILDGYVGLQEASLAHRLSSSELSRLLRAFSGGCEPARLPRFTPVASAWPFNGLKMFGYDLIMIDPPWPTEMRSQKGEKKSSAGKYGSMSFAEIAAMPVGQLASTPCVLFVWAVWPHVMYGGNPKLRYSDFDASRSPIGECIHAWGARVVTGGAWRKMTVNGHVAFGPGYRVRSSCEPWFMAVFGNPQETSLSARNIFDGLRREHSRKPEQAYAWCEAYLPEARRVEIFSRTSRPGWDTWGFEAGKFDPVVTVAEREEAAA